MFFFFTLNIYNNMNIIDMLLVGFSLSLDAFTLAITHGFNLKKISINKILPIALCYGVFQFIMPLIGYLFCSLIKNVIISIDHYIASFLLFFIGISMIINKDNESNNKSLIIEGLATSIDALIIGIVYKCSYNEYALITFIVIGIVTFINSIIGVFIGYKFNNIKYNSKIIGGVILIIMGIKILIEHLI